ncbi:unnamed protein product, partial [Iphiclides podalirius]
MRPGPSQDLQKHCLVNKRKNVAVRAVQRRHPKSRARDLQTHAARSQLTLATNGYSPRESYPMRRASGAAFTARLRRRVASTPAAALPPPGCILQTLPDDREEIQMQLERRIGRLFCAR